MSLDTRVRVLRGDAPCNACAEQVRRANSTGSHPREAALSPHGATFILTRETFGGAMLITTACERSVSEALLTMEAAAYPARDASPEVA